MPNKKKNKKIEGIRKTGTICLIQFFKRLKVDATLKFYHLIVLCVTVHCSVKFHFAVCTENCALHVLQAVKCVGTESRDQGWGDYLHLGK